MQEYDEQTLKRVQKLELGVLKDFISICERYELTYFALAGTGIGALRHQGFIPWDDDIDVALPRGDYEKFLKIAKEEFSDRYKIMNAEENVNYPLMTTRWMIKGTKFREEALQHIDCPLGIFLDIYAFDPMNDDEGKMKRQAWTAWFWSKLLILRSIPYPVLPFKGGKAKVAHAITAIAHYVMTVLHISKKWLYRRTKKASCRYSHLKTKRMGFFCDTSPFINMVSEEQFYPLQELPFEDIMLKFPRNLHQMLTDVYGDYMQLPPEEKRKNHFPFELDFGNAE